MGFCKLVLDYYSKQHFLVKDGLMDMRVAPFIYAEVAESLGFRYINKKQVLRSNTVVLSSKFFAQNKRDLTPYTFGIHRISHSWKDFNDYPFFRRAEKRTKHYFRVIKYNLLKK